MAGKPRLLALASGGGHWIELMRLRPAFADFETVYVSMFDNYAEQLEGARLHVIPDASRFSLVAFVPIFWRAIGIVLRERPKAMITTGSAPMLAFLLLGRLMGCRTLWIDSIANAEHLTSSGRIARKFASKVICQWPDVAEREGVECWGAIL
ncbi:MAG TPA: UDP-N-acetylglucosamine--LPS N-acetylglucosamine transferase [Sphingobium sp.]|nr:UDP-N-acetylglucosamine--LPS N-acetylglucosamine transferase [Sphingobium sp.]